MTTCSECFAGGCTGKALAEQLDRAFPHFGCEAEQCSPYSPGMLKDDENVAFLLVDPLHYDADRQTVVPDAFQELWNRDLSTVRVSHALRDEVDRVKAGLLARGAEKVPPQIRMVDEVCLGSVSNIRRNPPNGFRLMGIYDTALSDNRGHASIVASANVFTDRQTRKQVRQQVHAVFSRNRMSYSEFRETLRSQPIGHSRDDHP